MTPTADEPLELLPSPAVPTVEALAHRLTTGEDLETAIAIYKEARDALAAHTLAYKRLQQVALAFIESNLRSTGELKVKTPVGNTGWLHRTRLDEAQWQQEVLGDPQRRQHVEELEASIAQGKAAEEELRRLQKQYSEAQRVDEVYIR
jgi:hypothetical protein